MIGGGIFEKECFENNLLKSSSEKNQQCQTSCNLWRSLPRKCRFWFVEITIPRGRVGEIIIKHRWLNKLIRVDYSQKLMLLYMQAL